MSLESHQGAKEQLGKITVAMSINLISEMVKATIGKGISTKVNVDDIPEIVARAVASNLNV